MMDESVETSGPLVTVLVPTYNRRMFLPVALQSVVNQEYRNPEIIVTNDGGEDVSDIIESFHDSRIVLLNDALLNCVHEKAPCSSVSFARSSSFMAASKSLCSRLTLASTKSVSTLGLTLLTCVLSSSDLA